MKIPTKAIRIRKLVALTLAASLSLLAVPDLMPDADAYRKSPSKRYCRNHKKKCRKNIKYHKGRARVFMANKYRRGPGHFEQDEMQLIYDTSLSNEENAALMAGSELDPLPDCAHSGRYEYFECKTNRDHKKRRGCRTIVSWMEGVGSAFNDLQYRTKHHTSWCWRKRKIRKRVKPLAQWTEVAHLSWYFDYKGVNGGGLGRPWYRYFRGKRNSGHRKEYQFHLNTCLAAELLNICRNDWPYSRHYKHGDGTFRISGHNW